MRDVQNLRRLLKQTPRYDAAADSVGFEVDSEGVTKTLALCTQSTPGRELETRSPE